MIDVSASVARRTVEDLRDDVRKDASEARRNAKASAADARVASEARSATEAAAGSVVETLVGFQPDHAWEGTALKVKRPDGTFGPAVDLAGASAYETWLAEGNVGDEAAFLASMRSDLAPDVQAARAEALDALQVAGELRTQATGALETASTLASQVTSARDVTFSAAASAVSASGSAASSASAAERMRDQVEAAIASGSLITTDWATLQANTTAKRAEHIADALDDRRIGTYRRTVPDDATSPWVQASKDTVPALGARLNKAAGYVAPEVGLLPGRSEPPIRVEVNDAGQLVSEVSALGQRREVSASGALRGGALQFRAASIGLTDAFPEPPDEAECDRDGALISAKWIGQHDIIDVSWLPDGSWTTRVTALEKPAESRPRGTGTGIAIPPARFETPRGWVLTPPRWFTKTYPASVPTIDNLTLVYNSDTAVTAYVPLTGTVTVKRASDDAVLVEGTDYSLNRDRGRIRGLVNTANFAVKVEYVGYPQRVDLVSVNLDTMAFTYSEGTPKPRLGHLYEPTIPAGDVLLYRVFWSATDAKLLPMYLYRKRLRVNLLSRYEQEFARSRRCMTKTIARASRGQSIVYAYTGTSIPTMGGNGTAAELNEHYGTDGTSVRRRDRTWYFDQYPADIIAKMAPYDLGDGQGATAVELGLHWAIVRALRDLGANLPNINVKNYSIGGSNSSAAAFTNSGNPGYWNSTHPDKLTMLKASGAHLAAIDAAFNDETMNGNVAVGQTYLNYKKFAEEMYSVGSEVLMVMPTRRHPFFQDNVDNWLLTCQEVERAAYDMDAALFRQDWLYHPNRIAALGMTDLEICGFYMTNHPGWLEKIAEGDIATQMIKG